MPWFYLLLPRWQGTQVEVKGQLWEWVLSVHILCGFRVGDSGYLASTAIIFTGWAILPAHMCYFNPPLSETGLMMQLVYLKVLSRDHQAISFINTEHLKSQKTWRCHLPFCPVGSWGWSQDSHSLSSQWSHDQRKGGSASQWGTLRFGSIPGWVQQGRQRDWDKPAPRREASICQHSCNVEGLLWDMQTPPEPGELWASAGPVPGLCLNKSFDTVHWKAPGFYKWVTSWGTGVLAACYPHS